MYPIASQFVFDKFCGRINGDDGNKNYRKFEIENILKSAESSVIANGLIEKNFLSHQFKFDQVLIDSVHLPRKLSVYAQNDGLIVPNDPQLRSHFWIRNIRISDDITSANVYIHLHDDRVELKAIKTINASDELLMWFSEEAISFMGIPFLIPGNIQGEHNFMKNFR
jgi:hypothetical protein